VFDSCAVWGRVIPIAVFPALQGWSARENLPERVRSVEAQLHKALAVNVLSADHREHELFWSSEDELHGGLDAYVLRTDFREHELVHSAEDKLRDATDAGALRIDPYVQ